MLLRLHRLCYVQARLSSELVSLHNRQDPRTDILMLIDCELDDLRKVADLSDEVSTSRDGSVGRIWLFAKGWRRWVRCKSEVVRSRYEGDGREVMQDMCE